MIAGAAAGLGSRVGDALHVARFYLWVVAVVEPFQPFWAVHHRIDIEVKWLEVQTLGGDQVLIGDRRRHRNLVTRAEQPLAERKQRLDIATRAEPNQQNSHFPPCIPFDML